MTADMPNTFIQAEMPPVAKGEERVIMKITEVLVNMLGALNLQVYGPYVVYENGKNVLYMQALQALYGMLIAALL